MTKFVEDLTEAMMKIMEKNCGKHINLECEFVDVNRRNRTEEEVRQTIQKKLISLFEFMNEKGVAHQTEAQQDE